MAELQSLIAIRESIGVFASPGTSGWRMIWASH